jgi:ribosomal-protein-alanine N-acetyltransferase
MQLTPCRVEDLSELKDILRASPEAGDWSSASLSETLRSNPTYFLVAREENGITGFICGHRILDEGEILNLAVMPDARQRGVGTTLVRKLLELFSREGVAQVFLEVRESNGGAIAFYKGLGFREIGARAGYYQNPAEAALVLALKTTLTGSTTGTG